LVSPAPLPIVSLTEPWAYFAATAIRSLFMMASPSSGQKVRR
jgi:hypothetical protein